MSRFIAGSYAKKNLSTLKWNRKKRDDERSNASAHFNVMPVQIAFSFLWCIEYEDNPGRLTDVLLRDEGSTILDSGTANGSGGKREKS